MAEARALIPAYNREWTDHNASDPGIMLLELFAWLCETVMYRIDQVPDESKRKFISLVLGSVYTGDIESGIEESRNSLWGLYRAVTKNDYENLTTECMRSLWNSQNPGRAICMMERNLEDSSEMLEKTVPGHVSIIVIPRCNENAKIDYCSEYGKPTGLLKTTIKEYLHPRRLVTTQLHITGPFFHLIIIYARVALKPNTDTKGVRKSIIGGLQRFFDPFPGGADKQGWPLGRSVYISEVYAQIEGITGVDHVNKISLNDKSENIVLSGYELPYYVLPPVEMPLYKNPHVDGTAEIEVVDE
jgi:hypothetical protein